MNLFDDYLEVWTQSSPQLLEGLIVTLELLAGSCLLGFVLAIPLAIARVSGQRVVSGVAKAYSSVMRGTPLLVQIFIFYYGLSQFEAVRNSLAWGLLGDSFYCGLVVLTLNLTAYMAEDVRAGIIAVPAGEIEAARAYGLSHFQCYWRIVIPRALGTVTPVLGNEVIAQLKATALVSTITVLDLTGVVRRLAAKSYTTDALVMAGVMYALLTLVITWAVHRLEHKATRHVRR